MNLKELNKWQMTLSISQSLCLLLWRRARQRRFHGWSRRSALRCAAGGGTAVRARLLYARRGAVRCGGIRFVISSSATRCVGVVADRLSQGTVGRCARQYSGTRQAGQLPVGRLLDLCNSARAAFLDRRLYLPESWCDDPQRCAEAKIPADVVFQTKPQQAVEMLRHAWSLGVPMRWVTGDEVYGEAPYLRDAVAESGAGASPSNSYPFATLPYLVL